MILEIRRGRAKSRERQVIEPMFLVGANTDCDMVLGDPRFDPIHFYILSRNGQTTIRRVGAKPEVTVNGKLLRAATISDGDRIRTGPYEFLVKSA